MTVRLVEWLLEIDWDFDGTYTDETARLISASGQMRLTNPEEGFTTARGMVDRAELVLNNADGRFSPLNESGALYAYIGGGGAYHAPVRLSVEIDGGGMTRIFTGVIKLPQESTATTRTTGQIRLDCRSRDELLLNARYSSPLADFTAIYDDGATEEEIIAAWLTAGGAVDGTDFVSQAYHAANPGTPATLDVGFWTIPWAWLDDESPLEEIWRLAAACGGRFYCDPDGVYRYENAAHWVTNTSSLGTLDKGAFADLSAAYSDRDLFSGVTVEASPRFVTDEDELWSHDGSLQVKAGDTATLTAQLTRPAYTVTGAEYTAVTSGGENITADVDVSLDTYAQRIEITVTNNHATQAAILADLRINGQGVEGGPTIEERQDSVNAFWTDRTERRRAVRGNPYLQTQGQAGFVAEFLRDRYELPRLSFRVSGVAGDPAQRLGDRLTLSDADLMTTDRDGIITAITWRLTDAGFRHDFELIDATSLYPYMDTTPGYFIIGTNKLGDGGTSSLPGRLFY